MTDVLMQGLEAVPDDLLASSGNPELTGRSVQDVVELMSDRLVAVEERDRVLAAVVHAYRAERSPTWSAVLLAMLAPTLRAMASRYGKTLPRGIDAAELEQEIVTNALIVATAMKPPRRAHLMRIRMESGVRDLLRPWLRKIEREQQHESVDGLDIGDPLGEAGLEAVLHQMAVKSDGKITPADLAMAYRSRVLGHTLADLARVERCTVGVVRGRLRRVMARLAAVYPDAFGSCPPEVSKAA